MNVNTDKAFRFLVDKILEHKDVLGKKNVINKVRVYVNAWTVEHNLQSKKYTKNTKLSQQIKRNRRQSHIKPNSTTKHKAQHF